MASERRAFSTQQARAVLIDLQPPMDVSMCLRIQESLSNVLSVLANIGGPCRLPLLSLSVLRTYTECLYPLQPVKGNNHRIQGALSELRGLANELMARSRGNTRSSLLEGMQEVLTQHKRLSLSMKQGAGPNGVAVGSVSQVEITIVTAQEPQQVRQYVERVIGHLELESLKKILAVCVTDPDKLLEHEVIDHDIVTSMDSLSASPTDLSLSILDVVECDNDVSCMENIFKSWLNDGSTDSEHLHLSLPPIPSADLMQPLLLKCDIQERMLDPALLLSYTKNFILQTGSTIAPGRTNAIGTEGVPVHRLRAIGTVACSGVCESVLYGMPVFIRPTSCWKLDWEELETNQQYFQALCYHLHDKNEVLVAVVDGLQPPHGHYLILPSPTTATLLIKSVVVKELLLPLEQTDNEQPSPEFLDKVGESLAELPSVETYNPLLVQSQLYQVLSAPITISRGRARPTVITIGEGVVKHPEGGGRGVTPIKHKTGSTGGGRSSGSSSGRSLGPKRIRREFIYGGDHINN